MSISRPIPLKNDAFFYFTLIIGLLILTPHIQLHNLMASGDHGISLYAFERILHGEIPFRDFHWIYGPLMPYYFAAFLKMLGISVQSVLIAETLLTFCAGLMIFLTVRTLSFSAVGFTAALWFFVFEHPFFYTYNHTGGILAITVILFFMARYATRRSAGSLWAAAVAAFLLALTKLNFGLIGLFIISLNAIITDNACKVPLTRQKIFFHLFNMILLPVLIAAVYWRFLYTLSWTEINQCLPYFGNYQPYHISPLIAVKQHLGRFGRNALADPRQLFFSGIVVFSFINMLCSSKARETNKATLSFLAILAFYYVLNFHEYLLSGMWYRGIWAEPVEIVLLFTAIGASLMHLNKVIQALTIGAIILIAASTAFMTHQKLRPFHTPQHYLNTPRTRLFIQNDPAWIKTVQDTTTFLNNNLNPNATFLAFPYDPLYYYLTERKSPTRLLSFIEMIHVPPEQERAIIHDLEARNVDLILLSSTIHSTKKDLGFLGKTYCPILADYFEKNFTLLAEFGNWTDKPGWASNHGTRILKRIAP
jgi:hypothetical protein